MVQPILAGDGMPCGASVPENLPVGPDEPADVTSRPTGCDVGFKCVRAPFGLYWKVQEGDTDHWMFGRGVCRRYCIAGGNPGEGACGQRACLPDLPCSKLAKVPIPGVGLCAPEAPAAPYTKAGWWDQDKKVWVP